MRTSKFFKTGLLLFVASLGLISCGDDDKEPEIVVDPVSENVEYYIEGKVDFFAISCTLFVKSSLILIISS